ncbi:hypothetical protein ABZ816_38485 [Actinosynnema sp. NPDC047251]|uniref:Uncharacterized protein n=1 Tax=Saccharothrix espanaensis (strain ATCC 51144 / DSM 44229 / JCM 9112 / NBRC 15066 / NRRL 15764) TaxID=1179773 RepID=K0JUM0_SACES|nr:hypothetical protein [Saccharothrix espanaensis]CCH29202.1 hypothetical protein BN6_18820 [Saccharothrix espanaensis DSM 44229]
MADRTIDQPRSPVLIELCLLLRDFLGDRDLDTRLDDLTDDDLYRHIAFAASLQHSGRDFTARPTPELDHIAAAVLLRLSTGSLGDTSLRSPQARYAADATPRTVQVADGPASPDKPVGALWTSSFLPNGTSMWQWGELAEFGPDRQLFTVTFDPTGSRVFTINSPSDYGRLVTRYPRSSDGRAQVCWTRAAEDLDAVHLTVPGLLTAHHVPVETPHGTATLTGWDAESTAWLHLPPHLRTTPTTR